MMPKSLQFDAVSFNNYRISLNIHNFFKYFHLVFMKVKKNRYNRIKDLNVDFRPRDTSVLFCHLKSLKETLRFNKKDSKCQIRLF